MADATVLLEGLVAACLALALASVVLSWLRNPWRHAPSKGRRRDYR